MPKKTKGRSVDGYDPSSWPDVGTSMISQSMGNLHQDNSDNSRQSAALSKFMQPRPLHDSIVDENILRMVQYCRNLQLRIEELEARLELPPAQVLERDGSSQNGMAMSGRTISPPRGTTASSSRKQTAEQVASRSASHTNEIMIVNTDTAKTNKVHHNPGTTMEVHRTISPRVNAHDHDSGRRVIDLVLSSNDASDTMGRIDKKVTQLKALFYAGNPFRDRSTAAVKICAAARGFLVRVRTANFRRSWKEWKWLRCKQIVFLLDILLGNQDRLTDGYVRLKHRMERRILNTVYQAWANRSKLTAHRRRYIRKFIDDKLDRKRLKLMRLIYNQLKSVCVGDLSRKFANNARKLKMESIRNDMRLKLYLEMEASRAASSHASSTPNSSRPGSKTQSRPSSSKSRPSSSKGRHDGDVPVDGRNPWDRLVVSEDDVVRLYNYQVLNSFLEDKRMLLLKNTFASFVKLRQMAKQFAVDAAVRWMSVCGGRCFFAWKDYVRMTCIGINKKTFDGPRVFEVSHNTHRVETFQRRRQLFLVFKPWLEFYQAQRAVSKVVQRQLARFIRKYFFALREVTRAQRKMRVEVISNWKGYSKVLLVYPFQEWKAYYERERKEYGEKNRIVNSYLRWRWKQRLIKIMHGWRHFALYGKIDSLYSRQDLMNSLSEQRILSRSMERVLLNQDTEIDRCSELLATEQDRTAALQTKLDEMGEEMNRQKSETNKMEKKINRLNGIIEAMCTINPAQIEHLRKLQLRFKFKERAIVFISDELTDAKKEEEKKKEEEEEAMKNSRLSMEFDDDDEDDVVEGGEPNAGAIAENNGAAVDALNKEEDEETATADGGVVEPPTVGHISDALPPIEENQSGIQTISERANADGAPNSVPRGEHGDVDGKSEGKTLPQTFSFVGTGSSQSNEEDQTAFALHVEAQSRKRLAALLSKDDMLLYDRLTWLFSRLSSSSNAFLLNYLQTIQNGLPNSQTTAIDPAASSTALVEGQTSRTTLVNPSFATFNTTIGSMSGTIGEDPPYFEFEGVAANMLLGIVDFLKTGDVTAFSPEDRCDWVTHILKSATTQSAPVPPSGQTTPTTPASPGGQKLLSLLAPDSPKPPPHHDALAEAVDEIAKSTWRNLALEVRTQVPTKTMSTDLGTTAAAKGRLDAAATQAKLFSRFLEMRVTVKEALRRQVVKYYNRGFPGTGEAVAGMLSNGSRGLISDAYDIKETEDDDYYAALNIYAGNLKLAVNLESKATREARIQKEEAANRNSDDDDDD